MKLRKSQMAALLLIALSLILGACMNTASSPEATQDPFTGAGTSTGLPAGDTALVGVKFTPQYQGEMTERIRDMIAGQVKAADPMLQTVAVTANADDVARIFEMSDAVKSGQSVDELDSDIDSIVRNATTMR